MILIAHLVVSIFFFFLVKNILPANNNSVLLYPYIFYLYIIFKVQARTSHAMLSSSSNDGNFAIISSLKEMPIVFLLNYVCL